MAQHSIAFHSIVRLVWESCCMRTNMSKGHVQAWTFADNLVHREALHSALTNVVGGTV